MENSELKKRVKVLKKLLTKDQYDSITKQQDLELAYQFVAGAKPTVALKKSKSVIRREIRKANELTTTMGYKYFPIRSLDDKGYSKAMKEINDDLHEAIDVGISKPMLQQLRCKTPVFKIEFLQEITSDEHERKKARNKWIAEQKEKAHKKQFSEAKEIQGDDKSVSKVEKCLRKDEVEKLKEVSELSIAYRMIFGKNAPAKATKKKLFKIVYEANSERQKYEIELFPLRSQLPEEYKKRMAKLNNSIKEYFVDEKNKPLPKIAVRKSPFEKEIIDFKLNHDEEYYKKVEKEYKAQLVHREEARNKAVNGKYFSNVKEIQGDDKWKDWKIFQFTVKNKKTKELAESLKEKITETLKEKKLIRDNQSQRRELMMFVNAINLKNNTHLRADLSSSMFSYSDTNLVANLHSLINKRVMYAHDDKDLEDEFEVKEKSVVQVYCREVDKRGEGARGREALSYDPLSFVNNKSSIIRIRNNDSMCAARCVVAKMARDVQQQKKKSKKEKVPFDFSKDISKKLFCQETIYQRPDRKDWQGEFAKELIENTYDDINIGAGMDELEQLAEATGYKIYVVSCDEGKKINTPTSNGDKQNPLFLIKYKSDSKTYHYDLITDIAKCLGNEKQFWCFEHECVESEAQCNEKEKNCSLDKKIMKGKKECFMKTKYMCKWCEKCVELGNHCCCIRNRKKLKQMMLFAIYSDLETMLTNKIMETVVDGKKTRQVGGPRQQKVNLGIAIGEDNEEKVLFSAETIEEFVEKMIDDAVERKAIEEKDTLHIFHNGSKFDFMFIMRDILCDKGLNPIEDSIIMKGQKIICFSIEITKNVFVTDENGKSSEKKVKAKIYFGDSICFFNQSLDSLAKDIGLEIGKTFFPYGFSREDNQDFVGTFNTVFESYQMFRKKYYEEHPAIALESNDVQEKTIKFEYNKSLRLEHYNYFHLDNKKQKELLEFLETQRDKTFNLKKINYEYCKNDVVLLAKSINKFRNSLKKALHDYVKEGNVEGLTKLEDGQGDPFCNATVAGSALDIFLNLFYKDKSIPAFNNNVNRMNRAGKKALEWLLYNNISQFEKEVIVNERKETKDGKKYIEKHTWHVDGYDEKTKTMYEFSECYFHGCPKCYHPDDENKKIHRRMGMLYADTMARNKALEQKGYKVVHCWEHEWDEQKAKLDKKVQKKLTEKAKKHKSFGPLVPRDTLYGGRTEAFKLYFSARNMSVKLAMEDDTNVKKLMNKKHPTKDDKEELQSIRIHYETMYDKKLLDDKYVAEGWMIDVVSEYPSVLYYEKFPTSEPIQYKNISVKELKNKMKDGYLGFVKCLIKPNRNSYIPIIPEKKMMSFKSSDYNGEEVVGTEFMKLVFDNTEKVVSVTTVDLQSFMVDGGEIVEIYDCYLSEESSDSIFKKYIQFFFKMKAEAAGYGQKGFEAYAKEMYDDLGIVLDKKNCSEGENKSMKAVAKLYLNSLWGKYAENSEKFTKSVIVSDSIEYGNTKNEKSVILNAFMNKIVIQNIVPIQGSSKIYTTKVAKDLQEEGKTTSMCVASFTTAYGRRKLLLGLQAVGDRVCYCDTDSLVFWKTRKETFEDLKLNIGRKLGQFELEKPHKMGSPEGPWIISEFAATGAKSYYCMFSHPDGRNMYEKDVVNEKSKGFYGLKQKEFEEETFWKYNEIKLKAKGLTKDQQRQLGYKNLRNCAVFGGQSRELDRVLGDILEEPRYETVDFNHFFRQKNFEIFSGTQNKIFKNTFDKRNVQVRNLVPNLNKGLPTLEDIALIDTFPFGYLPEDGDDSSDKETAGSEEDPPMEQNLNQKQTRKASKVDKYLRKVFYSPAGFISAKPLAETIKRKYKISIPINYVKKWIEAQGISQITKVKKHKVFIPYTHTIPNLLHQADILYVDKAPSENKYILGVIDAASRYLMMVPLKKRDEDSVIEGLKTIYKHHKFPKRFESDKGSEFVSKKVQKYLKDNGVEVRILKAKKHAVLIERVFLTIQKPLFKFRDMAYRRDWDNILKEVIKAYNHRTHSTIGFKPSEAYKMKEIPRVFKELPERERHKPVFHIGMKVRLSVPHKRAVDFTFSDKTYMVTGIYWFDVKRGIPNVFVVDHNYNNLYTEYDMVPADVAENELDVARWYKTFE